MAEFDLIIRDANIVTEREVLVADIGIRDGRVTEIKPGLSGSARETIDARRLHVFPGLIDSHVHFNEPGRTEWEGIETGSKALAAGGGTLFFDMPLNAHPPTLDAASFDAKLSAAKASSLVDFAFWGGLTPGNLDRLEELAKLGVVGFKAFMSNSGIDDFPRADDQTLREGMVNAAALKKIVAVHAESETITNNLSARAIAEGKTSVRDYLDSRPIEAELDAITRALDLAAETKCSLHIVHVSCGAGVALVAFARKLGVNVTCETCPHYLVLTEADMEQIGALAKCAPPLRATPAQDSLWEYLKTEQINTVGSDHSPSPPTMKGLLATGTATTNFFKVWGGISGVQHTLPLLLTEGHVKRELVVPLIARLTSFNVAERFGLPSRKGRLAPGADADLCLVALEDSFEVRPDELFYRHRQTPYAGRKLTGKVRQTILRGQTVYRDGKITSKPLGHFVAVQ